jgi:hypothetical protein
MVLRITWIVALGLLPCLWGCGGTVKEQRIEVRAANDPLFEPRSILQRYADGQALGSEAASFPMLVEEVRKVDPDRAAILDQGLQDILRASPGERAAKAKQLLTQVQPSPG